MVVRLAEKAAGSCITIAYYEIPPSAEGTFIREILLLPILPRFEENPKSKIRNLKS